MGCGRRISTEFRFCPNCGRPAIIPYYQYPFPVQQPVYGEDSTIVHYILFALSLLVPLLGFLLGFLLTRSDNPVEDQNAGKICIVMAFFWPSIILLFIIRLLVFA